MLGPPPWLLAGTDRSAPPGPGHADPPARPAVTAGAVSPAALCPLGDVRPSGPAAATLRAVDRDGAVMVTGPAALAGLAAGDAVTVVAGPAESLVVTAGGGARIDARGRLRLPLWWRRRHLPPGTGRAAVAVVADGSGQLLVIPVAQLRPLILAAGL